MSEKEALKIVLRYMFKIHDQRIIKIHDHTIEKAVEQLCNDENLLLELKICVIDHFFKTCDWKAMQYGHDLKGGDAE